METIKRFFANPIVTGVVGLLVGVFIGLVVLGWWLMPVQWTDASPNDLRLDAKVTYMRNCIDAFGYNGDAARAQACYAALGEDAGQVWDEIVNNPTTQDPNLIAAFGSLALGAEQTGVVAATQKGQQPYPAAVDTGQQAYPPAGEAAISGLPQAGSTVYPLPKEAAEQTEPGGNRSWLTIICVGGLLLAAILALVALLDRFKIIHLGNILKPAAGSKEKSEEVDYGADGTLPISRNIASYQLGNDLFDEVYSIEEGGDFLGEYGVAIADYGGVGGPKRVSAFEVWLFDKNHIPTTTKVLMSEQAFTDNSKRQKLEAKGELQLAEPDHQVVLETNTLRLVGRVVDMAYGQGAAGSYFERFVLELKVFPLEKTNK